MYFFINSSFVVAHLSFYARPAERRSVLRNLKRKFNEARNSVRQISTGELLID